MTKVMMSYFNAPIAKFTDKEGRCVAASVRPVASISLPQLVELITSNQLLKELTQQVRQSPNLGEAKKQLLPFITPMGVFSYRKSDQLQQSSGLLVIDLDGELTSHEAAALRDRLFQDSWLHPLLCFVSPSGQGVKALVPYQPNPGVEPEADITKNLRLAMLYVQGIYGSCVAAKVDVSGKDVVRACFLCHDADAKYRFE